MPSGSNDESYVCVAAIAAPHGVRGAMKLKCFTADPEAVQAYGLLYDKNGQPLFKVRIQSVQNDAVVVTAPGITDRDAAAALRGTLLHVPRTALPPLEDDEFYLDDLIGLRCVDPNRQELGSVVAVYNFGAGDIVEIRDQDGKERMLPFTKVYFPEIDAGEGYLTVCLPNEVQEDQGT